MQREKRTDLKEKESIPVNGKFHERDRDMHPTDSEWYFQTTTSKKKWTVTSSNPFHWVWKTIFKKVAIGAHFA